MGEGSSEGLAQWLKAAARGDQTAWRQIIEEMSPRVFGLLRARCKDPDLAEELTQSVFVTVAEKLTAYVESGKFESWVFRIAMNRLRDEMRRRGRQAAPMPDEALDSGSVREQASGTDGYRTVDPAERDQLERALAGLTQQDREIVDLRFIAGLSFAQIAAMLDEPLGTLLARHHRALAKLRTAIERDSKGG